MKTAALLLLAALAGTGAVGPAAAAAATAEDTPSVSVNGIRNPEMRSYRSVWAGLDTFDEYRSLAPAAPLRFRILRADGSPAGSGDGLALRLASDEGSAPVPIGADGLLTIERNRAAYDADASFILNQKDGVFSARPEIRTPGVPADARRLGDLRLECRVMVAIAKERMSFVAKAALNTLMLGSDWCGRKDMNLAFPSPPGLESARISHGARTLELTLHDKDFMAPIGDRSWPDDALITLKFAPAGR